MQSQIVSDRKLFEKYLSRHLIFKWAKVNLSPFSYIGCALESRGATIGRGGEPVRVGRVSVERVGIGRVDLGVGAPVVVANVHVQVTLAADGCDVVAVGIGVDGVVVGVPILLFVRGGSHTIRVCHISRTFSINFFEYIKPRTMGFTCFFKENILAFVSRFSALLFSHTERTSLHVFPSGPPVYN